MNFVLKTAIKAIIKGIKVKKNEINVQNEKGAEKHFCNLEHISPQHDSQHWQHCLQQSSTQLQHLVQHLLHPLQQ